ncbi:hypothetical protein K503DRAFT_866969 [Rhizopogon vinicolor AM-OR11-026]|uniref:Uncharacterized protein n=1 Tax=Rhizopogon vinicolor AM-OR11-026 TaxID=1314800 RepID=A0A1B7MXG6_9AGAM|nr:hypothetical protein K503DRAFT_866969 [Rhizopogon vinicolor AM-OR11-026]
MLNSDLVPGIVAEFPRLNRFYVPYDTDIWRRCTVPAGAPSFIYLYFPMTSIFSEDTAAATSVVLESILYGEYRRRGHPYCMGVDLQTSHVGPELPDRFGSCPVVDIEYGVVDIMRVEDELVKYHDTFQGGSTAYFSAMECSWVQFFVSQIITAFFTSTLATNLMGPGLLAYRIWIRERSVSAIRATKSPMMHVLRLLIDATILCSLALFAALLCFLLINSR